MRDDTLSELAALKQDAKDFGWRQMAQEREKRAKLEPLYRIAKALLPKLAISQQNLLYYASLANFYTVYDLRRLKPEQTHLYLLCYAWQRYRQLTDNLVDALGYHMKQLEDESKAWANKHFVAEQVRRQQETPQVGRLLLLYVDDDGRRHHAVRRRAPARVQDHAKDALQIAGQRLSVKPASKLALRWQVVDGLAERIRRHLRPLYGVLDFASVHPDNPWLAALAWAKSVFAKTAAPVATPARRMPGSHAAQAPAAVSADVRRGRQADGRARRPLRVLDVPSNQEAPEVRAKSTWTTACSIAASRDELVSLDEKADVLSQMDIPWLRQPIETQLNALTAELRAQWLAFNRELRQGKLKHLDYDSKTKTLTWRKPKADNDAAHEDASTSNCRSAMSPTCSAL